MPYKIDLHTHSVASADGSLDMTAYQAMLKSGGLDCIAVTDHDTISMAKRLQADLGERIIVGEEISTREGEIIGLYLTEGVPPHLSALETVQHIKAQHGLVYVPHPFETVRGGLPADILDTIAEDVDIIEVVNGRAIFQNFGNVARAWAAEHDVAVAASSDAHGRIGWGRTYTMLAAQPTRDTLVTLLRTATIKGGRVGIRGALYPKLNRLRKGRKHV